MLSAFPAQAELEIRQRDVVIKEMADLIFHNFKGRPQEELLKFLQSHPKAIQNPKIIGVEPNYVFWGTTIKFKYQNDVLINVSW
jgi:hypothetical protein